MVLKCGVGLAIVVGVGMAAAGLAMDVGLTTILLLVPAPNPPKLGLVGLLTGGLTRAVMTGARMFSKCATRFRTPALTGPRSCSSTSSAGCCEPATPNGDVVVAVVDVECKAGDGDGSQSMDPKCRRIDSSAGDVTDEDDDA